MLVTAPRAGSWLPPGFRLVDPSLIVSGIGEQPAVQHMRDFGLASFTSGCVCVAPRLSMKMLAALRAKDYESAEGFRTIFQPLEDLRNAIHPIRVLHSALSLAGIAETGPILPLLDEIGVQESAEVRSAATKLLEADRLA